MPRLAPEDFAPSLLSAFTFSWASLRRPSQRLEPRICLDYELETILEGGGSQVIDGQTYPMEAGALVFRRPGQATQGTLPYRCHTLLFQVAGKPLVRPSPYFPTSEEDPRWPPQPSWESDLLDPIPPCASYGNFEVYRGNVEAVIQHFINPESTSPLLIRSLLLRILSQLHRDAQASTGRRGLRIDPRLALVYRHIGQHFNRPLTLDQLATLADLSPNYLQHRFKETFGESPQDMVQRLRLDHSRQLLVTTDLPLARVARASGFRTGTYFFTRFRQLTGLSPGEFRERHRW